MERLSLKNSLGYNPMRSAKATETSDHDWLFKFLSSVYFDYRDIKKWQAEAIIMLHQVLSLELYHTINNVNNTLTVGKNGYYCRHVLNESKAWQ